MHCMPNLRYLTSTASPNKGQLLRIVTLCKSRLHPLTCNFSPNYKQQSDKSAWFRPVHSRLLLSSCCSHAARSVANNTNTTRKVRHILLTPQQGPLLSEIHSQLADGIDFVKLVSKYSSCRSAKRSGELGWVKRGLGLPHDFEDAIFSAHVGKFTSAETEKGIHIFQVIEEKEINEVQRLTVSALDDMLRNSSDSIQFIDVREQGEYQIASLPHFQLRPMSQISQWLPSLKTDFDTNKPTVCLCHAGMRSLQVANFLIGQGFITVYNVEGGIEAFSCSVDSSVPRY